MNPPAASWRFDAIGTRWQIDSAAVLDDTARARIGALIDGFDREWSRFRPDSLVSALAARALSEGTERYDAIGLVEAAERLGAELHASAGWDAASASVEVPAPRDGTVETLHRATAGWVAGVQDLLGQWAVQVKRAADAGWDSLAEDAVRRAWLLLRFEAADG